MTDLATKPLTFRSLDATQPELIDVMTGPTPEQIDKACAYYDSAVRAHKATGECLEEAKGTLLTLVRGWGHPVAGSESSRELEGRLNSATMTAGRTITVHETLVYELHNTLSEAGHDEFFDKLFEVRTRHELVAGANDALKTSNLPKKLTEKILNLFGRCITVKDKAPSLKVDLLHKEPKPLRTRAKKAEVLA